MVIMPLDHYDFDIGHRSSTKDENADEFSNEINHSVRRATNRIHMAQKKIGFRFTLRINCTCLPPALMWTKTATKNRGTPAVDIQSAAQLNFCYEKTQKN